MGAEGADSDHDDIPFTGCSSASVSRSADGDDESGPSDDEIGPVDNDDVAENLNQFVQDYWICFSNDHSTHYGLMASKDEPRPCCSHSGTTLYYYLGLHQTK